MGAGSGGLELDRTVHLLLGLGALVVVLAAPAAQASSHIPEENRDESRTIEAGQYLGYRIEAPQDGRIVFSGSYDDVTTEQPVLPVLLVIDRADEDSTRMWGTFVHPDGEGEGLEGYVRTPVAGENFSTYDRKGDGRGVSVSTPVDAGTYNVFVATAPADGPAEASIHVPGDATIVATEKRASLFERGIDHSAVGWDLTLRASSASTFVRSWGYSGADVPFTVADTLHGYMGGPAGSPAHWINPDGEVVTDDFVRGGPAGQWTASFPAEQYQGPVCDVVTSCFPQPFVENPPYAFGVRTGLATGG